MIEYIVSWIMWFFQFILIIIASYIIASILGGIILAVICMTAYAIEILKENKKNDR